MSHKLVFHLMQAGFRIPLATCLPMLASALPTNVTSANNHHTQTPPAHPTPALSHTDSTPEDEVRSTVTTAYASHQGATAVRKGIRKLFSCINACMTGGSRPQETVSTAPPPAGNGALARQLRNQAQRPSSPAPEHRQTRSQPRLPAVHGRASASASAEASGSNTLQSLRSKQRAMLDYASRGDLLNMRMLSEYCPDTFHQLRDENGNTVLHLAAASDNAYAAVFCLFNLQCDLESRNHAGRTPLLEAAARGRDTSVEMLLDWGANILAHDVNRQSAFTLAKLRCKPETYQLLERRLADRM